jgi:hypothetical protein
MNIEEIKKYQELREKIEKETQRIFDLTVAEDCPDEPTIVDFDCRMDDNAVAVVWKDFNDYESGAIFPFSYYSMTDDEVRAAWEKDNDENY